MTPGAPIPGARIVLDLRPLQEPERAPLTAAYLEALVGAYAADPLAGESFVILLRVDRPDPTAAWPGLAVAGRRMLPAARLVTSAIPAGDQLLIGGASLGAGFRADRTGAAGTVFHAVGSVIPFGARMPLATGPGLVVSLLDLAPWQLPEVYQRTTGARFAARLRRRIMRDSDALIVGTEAVRGAVQRLLRVPADRVAVVPPAPRAAFAGAHARTSAGRADAAHHGLLGRYLMYWGRFDARQDLPTLLAALAELATSGRPATLPPTDPWPPLVGIIGASPDDRAAIARVAARDGVGDHLRFVPIVPDERLAAMVAGARGVLVPALADALGLAAIDALAAGVPVVATTVDGLPEIVGDAGIIVQPRQPTRLATAISTLVVDDRLRRSLVARTRQSPATARTWADVAGQTRQVYADAIRPRS